MDFGDVMYTSCVNTSPNVGNQVHGLADGLLFALGLAGLVVVWVAPDSRVIEWPVLASIGGACVLSLLVHGARFWAFGTLRRSERASIKAALASMPRGHRWFQRSFDVLALALLVGLIGARVWMTQLPEPLGRVFTMAGDDVIIDGTRYVKTRQRIVSTSGALYYTEEDAQRKASLDRWTVLWGILGTLAICAYGLRAYPTHAAIEARPNGRATAPPKGDLIAALPRFE